MLVCTYEYDAWGNLTSVKNANGAEITSQNHIAFLNPIRYRGYYFDSEIGMYYLQSRYYDPSIGRFINADGYITTGQGVLSYNMFAYCLNNPVMLSDPSGKKCIFDYIEEIYALMQGICNGKILPYASADEAALAFSNKYYSSSLYIRHEYGTYIYSITYKGITTYAYSTPVVGEPHRIIYGPFKAPSGLEIVAFAHTHPNSSWFSPDDMDNSNYFNVNTYVVGPDLMLRCYVKHSGIDIKGNEIETISPIALTIEQKNALIDKYRVSWDNHVSEGCEFNCASIAWPTP